MCYNYYKNNKTITRTWKIELSGYYHDIRTTGLTLIVEASKHGDQTNDDATLKNNLKMISLRTSGEA